MKRFILLILLLLSNCEPGVRVAVDKDTVLGHGCPDSKRTFNLSRKLGANTDSYVGEFIFKGNSIEIEMNESIHEAFMIDDKYIVVFGAALGSSYDSYRLEVRCPSSNKLLFDSHEVSEEEGSCTVIDGENVLYNFFLEPEVKIKFDCR
jgi:hypothetical protein